MSDSLQAAASECGVTVGVTAARRYGVCIEGRLSGLRGAFAYAAASVLVQARKPVAVVKTFSQCVKLGFFRFPNEPLPTLSIPQDTRCSSPASEGCTARPLAFMTRLDKATSLTSRALLVSCETNR